MRITDARLDLASTHELHADTSQTASFRTWGGSAAPTMAPASPQDAVTISETAAQTCATGDPGSDEEPVLDPQLELLRAFAEWFLGTKLDMRRIRQIAAQRGASGNEAAGTRAPERPAPAHAPAPQAPQAATGAGFEYKAQRISTEHEVTRFTADAVVRTSDGRDIAVSMRVEMSRASISIEQTIVRGGQPEATDPLVLNFSGTAAALTDRHVSFDLDADGTLDAMPIVAQGNALLAIDRNGDGRVTDGRELFGPSTSNGFAELAAYDGDANGWIDENDAAFAELRVWTPSTDGPGTLETLEDRGVGAIAVDAAATPFTFTDPTSGAVAGYARAASIFVTEKGEARLIQQVDVVT